FVLQKMNALTIYHSSTTYNLLKIKHLEMSSEFKFFKVNEKMLWLYPMLTPYFKCFPDRLITSLSSSEG
ncbi:hypothetical protein ACWKSR_11225, partial [Campylobacter fetus subsp. venerealis]